MVQQVKVLAANPDDLGSIPRDPHGRTRTSCHPLTSTYIHGLINYLVN